MSVRLFSHVVAHLVTPLFITVNGLVHVTGVYGGSRLTVICCAKCQFLCSV